MLDVIDYTIDIFFLHSTLFFSVILAIAVQTQCEIVDSFFPEYEHATRSNIPLGQVVRNSRGRFVYHIKKKKRMSSFIYFLTFL